MTAVLRLTRTSRSEIQSAAAASPDREICGLLVESEGIVVAHLTPNIHPDPAMGFAICDAAHARLQRRARAQGARIVGCVHSHPSGETAPSETDLLAAHEDGFIWLICAPDGRMQAWRAVSRNRSKSFLPVAIAQVMPHQSAIAAAP